MTVEIDVDEQMIPEMISGIYLPRVTKKSED
jgi:hypothetical protein